MAKTEKADPIRTKAVKDELAKFDKGMLKAWAAYMAHDDRSNEGPDKHTIEDSMTDITYEYTILDVITSAWEYGFEHKKKPASLTYTQKLLSPLRQ